MERGFDYAEDRFGMPKLNVDLRMLAGALALVILAATACSLSGCGASETRGADQGKAPEIVYSQGPATRPAPKVVKSSGSGQVSSNTAQQPSSQGSADPSSGEPVDPRGIMAVFRKYRISTVDRTPSMPSAARNALTGSIERLGGSGVVLYGTPDGCEFLAIGFSNERALHSLVEAPPDILIWQNIVLAPVSAVTSTWEQIAKAVEDDGGRRVDSIARECQVTLEVLASLRSAIAQFIEQEGVHPDFANRQWRQMQDAKLLTISPRNPLAKLQVSGRIEIVDTPGLKGDSTNPNKAGWVWNSHDAVLYAAGHLDETLMKLAQGAPGGKHYIALPEEHVAIRLQTLRGAIALAKPPQNSRTSKKASFPTFTELIESLRARESLLANPINGSAEIQLLDWSQKSAPVKGNAGWNYDPKFGKIWANSNVLGENEL